MAETTWDYTIRDFSPLVVYSGSTTSSSSTSNLDETWSQDCPIQASPHLDDFLCDASSSHTTTTAGATVLLNFYGQSITLYGNVTGGMAFDVNLDGTTFAGTPNQQILASISNLSLSTHSVSITANPPPDRASDATLLFESATVTIGTGLTGANVTRTVIQDDDPSLAYTVNPASVWSAQSYDAWGIRHPNSNAGWHMLSATNIGSLAVPFSGSAIMVYGPSWSYFPSDYVVSVDNQPHVTLFANSSLPNSQTGHIYIGGLHYIHANLTDSLHTLVINNNKGLGYLGIDHMEVITVTGGTSMSEVTVTSSSCQHPQISVAGIVGAVLGVVALLIIILFFMLYHRRRSRRSTPKLDFDKRISLDGDAIPVFSPFVSPVPTASSSQPLAHFPHHSRGHSQSTIIDLPRSPGAVAMVWNGKTVILPSGSPPIPDPPARVPTRERRRGKSPHRRQPRSLVVVNASPHLDSGWDSPCPTMDRSPSSDIEMQTVRRTR